MRYEIPVMWHNKAAKTQGLIPETINPRTIEMYSPSAWEWLVIDVPGDKYSPATDATAYAMAIKRLVTRKDRRPIAGQSYVRKWRAPNVMTNDGLIPFNKLSKFRKDDRIILHTPYRADVDFSGYRLGIVDEVLSDSTYGLKLDGYPYIVDFAIREFALFDQEK